MELEFLGVFVFDIVFVFVVVFSITAGFGFFRGLGSVGSRVIGWLGGSTSCFLVVDVAIFLLFRIMGVFVGVFFGGMRGLFFIGFVSTSETFLV